MGTATRIALRLLAAACLAVAAMIVVHDVAVGEVNCGSAIFARDAGSQTFVTGNVADDDFARQQIVDECGHLILRQRYLTALALGAMGVATWLARRPDDRPAPLPGDPVV